MPTLSAATGRLDQGVVLDGIPWNLESPPLGIALSNACDLEHDKADFLILAALKPARAVVQASAEFRNKVEGANGTTVTKRAWGSLCSLAEDLIHNSSIRRYFLLDARAILGLDLLLVDFQHLISIPLGVARRLPALAELPSPHREKLVVHFASYTSRIAVDRAPDTDTAEMRTLLIQPYHGPEAELG